MLSEIYNVIKSIITYLSWMLIGRWSKLNRLADRLETLKTNENQLCDLLLSLNEAYLQQSKDIQKNRQNIALERLQILEQIGKISVPEKHPKTCEILEVPKIPKKSTKSLSSSPKKSAKKGQEGVAEGVVEAVPSHMISGTNSYIDLL